MTVSIVYKEGHITLTSLHHINNNSHLRDSQSLQNIRFETQPDSLNLLPLYLAPTTTNLPPYQSKTMLTTTLALALLPLLTSALPSPFPATSDTSLCKKSYTANYDDISPGPVAVLDVAPSPYLDLGTPGFFVVPPGLLSGVTAHSPPNVIGFNLVGGAVSGSPATLTTQYAGSKVKSLSLKTVWLSCTIINPAGIYVAQSCSVHAAGTKVGGGTVEQDLTFTVPGGLLGLNPPVLSPPVGQQEQTFSGDWTGLESVTFSTVAAGTNPVLTGVSFDDFVYELEFDCADCAGCAAA